MAREDRLRTRIAVEAARIMAEEGIHEHGLAKKKATARIGAPQYRNLPKTEEIDAALDEHHRLFGSVDQPRRLARLRKIALEAMTFLEEFSPALVGGVWNGGAGRFSPVRIHLFPAAPEFVMRKLLDARIPFEQKSFLPPRDADTQGEHPALHFYADDILIELILLPEAWRLRSLRRKNGQPAGGGIGDVKRVIELEALPGS